MKSPDPLLQHVDNLRPLQARGRALARRRLREGIRLLHGPGRSVLGSLGGPGDRLEHGVPRGNALLAVLLAVRLDALRLQLEGGAQNVSGLGLASTSWLIRCCSCAMARESLLVVLTFLRWS